MIIEFLIIWDSITTAIAAAALFALAIFIIKDKK